MARRGFAQYMEHERGFRGWLVFFFVTMCIALLVRAFVLWQIGRVLPVLFVREIPAPLKLAVVVQFLIETALILAMIQGLRLFADQDPRTPRFWPLFFLLSVPAVLAIDAIAAFQVATVDKSSFGLQFWELLRSGGARGILLSLCWAAYWSNSKRVLLTYGGAGFYRPPPPEVKDAVGTAKLSRTKP
jgi:hypothetical protein